jgi:prepilin-type N-terminal cleavage/methylation domain-containing protein
MNAAATDRRLGQGGFTLIEVMAAIVVFLIGVVGVLGLLTSGTRLHQESQTLVVTNDIAEEVLLLAQRELAERAPAASDSMPEPPPPHPVPSRPELLFSWKVLPAADLSLYLLKVEVGWMEHGRPQTRNFERVLPRLSSVANDARTLMIGKPK